MKKKNLFLRIAMLMLIATVATCGVFVGSGTTAKYVAQATATATAEVALFDVKIQTGASTWSPNIAVTTYGVSVNQLGQLLQPAGTNGDGALSMNHSANTIINSTTGTHIAPGTGGKVTITLRNDSEVAVDVWLVASSGTVDYPTGSGIVFSNAVAGTFGTLADAMAAANGGGTNKIRLDPVGGTTTAQTFDLYWKWPFYTSAGQDTTDTNLGTAGTAKLTVPLNVRVEQAD